MIKSTSSHASLSHYKRDSDHLWRYSSKSNQEYKREEIEAELMATLSVPATVPSPSEDAEQLHKAFEGLLLACPTAF